MDKSSDIYYPRERVDIFGSERAGERFPRLAEHADKAQEFRQLRICIITQDFVGPVRNGGIGTAYTYAARSLAAAGHAVTVFYCSRSCVNQTLQYWRDYYQVLGIDFVYAGDLDVKFARGQMTAAMRIPYVAYDWLRSQPEEFDFVHVSEWNANGYLCLQAKHSGLYFNNTTFVVKCSSPMLWNRIGNAEPITDLRSLSMMYMERRSVELADYVICGSEYLLNWMIDQGYRLPVGRTYTQPNIFPYQDTLIRDGERVPEVRELVFFGRLEPRKGIHFFVDALLGLKQDGSFDRLTTPLVTFLGKPRKNFDLAPLLDKLEKHLGVTVQVLDNKSQPEALAYLQGGDGRVAVMPSLMDNSPFGVYECLAKAIPFITSTAGGGKELIDPAYHRQVLFEPRPAALAETLRRVLEQGCPVAAPSFDFEQNVRDWMNWHLWVAAKRPPAPRIADAVPSPTPLISVCVAHHNRGDLLPNAIESIMRQSYRNLEIIVVDDGSSDARTLEVLDQLEAAEHPLPLRIIRQSNQYLGAVRNTGIRNASGEFVMFMDDDNEAKPNEIETFLRVARHTGADVLTCWSDTFVGKRPNSQPEKSHRILFQGDNLSMALMRNPFGDSNCFARREALQQIDGFTEHYKVGMDDLEFFIRAHLSGLRIFLVPEALYWYRINEVRMRQNQYNLFAGRVRVMESLTQGLDPDIANILRYAQGMSQVFGTQSPKASEKQPDIIQDKTERVERLGRRVVERLPFLYPLARKVYRRLFRA